jgi:uncharacterized Ntn-hydrolase superfamily protein
MSRLSTFSIVAFHPATGDLGVAVESKFLAVGAVVSFAQAGVGAVATQAWANTSYGPRALRMMKRGVNPKQIAEKLVARDQGREQRQFGLVDAQGRAFSYTGSECFEWAGGLVGKNFAAQGDILANDGVVEAMARTFEASAGDLAERLLAALAAGQAAGGDRRGQESAALLVVRAKGGYGGFNDRFMDLRVDDHPAPIDALKRLLDLHRLYLNKSDPNDLIAIDANIARELQTLMKKRGFYAGAVNGQWDDATRRAFREFAGVENLEERLQEGPFVDKVVLKFLRERFGK